MFRGTVILCVALIAAGCGSRLEERAPRGDAPTVWGGPGRQDGWFYMPRAMAIANDNLHVVDKTGRLQTFDFNGNRQATWTLPLANRGYPTGMGVRPDGAIALASTHDYVVRIFSPDGRLLQTIGREGGGPGEFTYLTDVEFDRGGSMYVSEHGRVDRVQRFDAAGRFVTSWGTTGEAPGEFQRPQALAVDGEGSVYVADAGNHRVQKFTSDGELLAVWGEPGSGSGQMLYPYDLAITGDGMLLVCEYGNNRVQAFDREGRSLGTWGRPGREPGELAAPWAVVWRTGRIYVADTENHRVQSFAMAPGLLTKR